MQKIGPWWVFLGMFLLMIAAVLSLGWWTRLTAAPLLSPSSPSSSAHRHLSCQPKHWRALVMQQ